MSQRPIHRRALLLGAAGTALLAACDGRTTSTPAPNGSPTATSSGPIVREQDPGNVVSTADIERLVKKLDDAFQRGDAEGMRDVVPGLDVAEWRNRMATLTRFPVDSVGFAFDETDDRPVNASGGAVDFRANLALTHRVQGCDARPVTQLYDAQMRKPGKDAPVSITRLSGPFDWVSPAPWDLDDYAVVQGEHVVLTALPRDLERARSGLARIDAGVSRAMALIPPGAGVSKIFVALADSGSPLFSDGAIKEVLGLTMRIGFVDAKVAARTGRVAKRGGTAYAGSRVLLRPSAFETEDQLESTSMHESVHALAYSWGDALDGWVVEGLAEWASTGFADGLRASGRARAVARSGFAGFRPLMLRAQDPRGFYDSAVSERNYVCSSAVYSYLEETFGRDATLRFARGCYAGDTATSVRRTTGGSTTRLHRQVGRWVAAL